MGDECLFFATGNRVKPDHSPYAHTAKRFAVPRLRWALLAELGALLVIWIGAGFLRAYRLADLPPGLCLDEVMDGSLARDILNGRHEVYIEEAYGHEPLYHYFQAASLALFGPSPWAIRLPSVLCGLALIAGVWWLGRTLYGSPAALVAAGGLAAGWWGVFYSRVGIRAISTPLFLVLALIGLWVALYAPGRRRWGGAAAGGLALGLSLYTYPAARAVVWLPLLVMAHLAFSDRARLRARWRPLLLLVALAVFVAAPIVVYLATHAEVRTAQLSEPVTRLRQGDPSLIAPLIRDTLLMPLGLAGDPRYLYNLSGRPIWGPVWGVLLAAGLGLALWHWRRPGYALLPAWLLAGLLPGMVTPDAPSTIRTITALPAAYLLAALPVGVLAQTKRSVRPHHLRRPGRSKAFVPAAWGLLAVGVAALIVGHGVATWRDLQRWAGDFEVQWRYQTPLFQAAAVLDASADDTPICVSTPLYTELAVSSLDLALTRRDLAIRWFNGDGALLFPDQVEGCRYLYTDATAPDPVLLDGWLDGAQTGESLERRPDGRPFYRFYRLPSVTLDGWGEQEAAVGAVGTAAPLALPANWGNQVELLGYRWVGTQPIPGGEAVLLTAWRVHGPADPALNLFVHLLDESGQFVAGQDRLDVPPQTWLAGDMFVQVHRLALPAGLRAGTYWPELGWYSRDTGMRLTLVNEGGAAADRLLLAAVEID